MKMISKGTQVWRRAELAFFGPANSCPSALCQNMLGVHLDCCPWVSAPGWSCGCLHDNSRSGVNCCTWSQMLLCTCGLIRQCSRPPTSLTTPPRIHTTLSPLLPPSNPHPHILSQSVLLSTPLVSFSEMLLLPYLQWIIHSTSMGVPAVTQALF